MPVTWLVARKVCGISAGNSPVPMPGSTASSPASGALSSDNRVCAELADKSGCVAKSYHSAELPANVLFVVDTSGSMQDMNWSAAAGMMNEILNMYPRVKGIQVMDDEGAYMFSEYRGQWIPDSPARRKAIFSLPSPPTTESCMLKKV